MLSTLVDNLARLCATLWPLLAIVALFFALTIMSRIIEALDKRFTQRDHNS